MADLEDNLRVQVCNGLYCCMACMRVYNCHVVTRTPLTQKSMSCGFDCRWFVRRSEYVVFVVVNFDVFHTFTAQKVDDRMLFHSHACL